jgi:hypothetical protein
MPGTWRKKTRRSKGGEKPHAEKIERTSAKLDHVLVSGGGTVPRKFNVPGAVRKQKKVLLGSVVLLLVAGAVAIYFAGREPEKPIVYGCPTSVLQKASAKLDPTKVEELEPIVHEIKHLPKYDQDANCLYVLITYYINISDASAAADTLAKLKLVYDPTKGYDPRLTRSRDQSPEHLQPIVDFLQQQAARYQNVDFRTGAPR